MTSNGVCYHVNIEKYGDNYSFTIKNDNNKNYQVMLLDIANGEMVNKEYTFVNKTWYGIDKYEEENTIIKYEDMEGQLYESLGITYGSKTTEQYKEKYWYRYGNGVKTDRTYLKIGCDATYRIRTDNLASNKLSYCDKYTSSIKNVNKYMKAANGYLIASGAGVVLTVVVAIVVTLVAWEAEAIAAVLVTTFGGDIGFMTKLAENALKANREYQDVKDYYSMIKSYGVKL